MLADQLGGAQRERNAATEKADLFARELEATAEALHAALDAYRVTQLRLDKTRDSLRRLMDASRAGRLDQQERLAA